VIATVAARTGIAPLALRDVAVDDARLFDELVEAVDAWTPQLELAASQIEVTHELYRVVLSLGGVKQLPKPLAITRSTKPKPKPIPRVSIAELAALTSRDVERRAT
jgi:hypothetical protein